MLKDNEFKITIRNFRSNDANGLIRVILKYIDEEQIVVKYLRISKGKNSVNLSFVIQLLYIFAPVVNMIHLYLEIKRAKISDKRGNQKSDIAELTEELKHLNINFEAIREILDKTIDPQKENYAAEAEIGYDHDYVTVKNNEISEEISIPDELIKTAKRNSKIERKVQEEEKLKECHYCGTMNDLDAIYCKHCGEKLE